MLEREPKKEKIERGELLYLWHPGTTDKITGYGLTTDAGVEGKLTGLIMVDRPKPVNPEWLDEVERTYGHYQLFPMTAGGERGIACQINVEPESQQCLRLGQQRKSTAIREALKPLLADPPNPIFNMWWDEDVQLWRSLMTAHMELPPELREVFEKTGYGSLAVGTSRGVYHICHAADADIEGFPHKGINYRWQFIKMPTAPLVRLELFILDQPENPYRFESFLNVAADDQAKVLDNLANQDELHLGFYGDGLQYRYTKSIPHAEQQWQQLDEMVEQAARYWEKIPVERRDFDLAKAAFMSQSL